MRLRSLLAFGVGYVLGSKAGRERYEQNLAGAKRASTRLDEYGRRLERFSPRRRAGTLPVGAAGEQGHSRSRASERRPLAVFGSDSCTW